MRTRKYILLILLLISFYLGYSQDSDYFDDFREVFNNEMQEKISKITVDFNEAQSIENEADNLLSSQDTSKSLNMIKKAADIYETNYRNLYLMFDEKLTGLIQDIEDDKKLYAERLVNDAKNSFRLSIANRLSAGEIKQETLAYELYVSAHSSETDAINTQCHTFAILTGRINEDMTLIDTDYSLSEFYDNSVTDNFNNRSFAVVNASLPDNFNYNKSVNNSYNNNIYNNNNTYNNNNSSNYNNNNYQTDPIHESSYADRSNEYRIQIGTSIIPADLSQIRRINSTNLEVKSYKSKIYYKYTIGSFSSFQEAKNYKNAYGLAKTYIVEYRNGKEVKFYYKDYQ